MIYILGGVLVVYTLALVAMLAWGLELTRRTNAMGQTLRSLAEALAQVPSLPVIEVPSAVPGGPIVTPPPADEPTEIPLTVKPWREWNRPEEE